MEISANENKLLSTLPDGVRQALTPNLQQCTLVAHQVLHEPGDAIRHAIFPQRGVISLIVPLSSGEAVEIAMVGMDGLVGGFEAINQHGASQRAVVQAPGAALTIEMGVLRELINMFVPLRDLITRHQHALMIQAQQAAACTAAHNIEQRLARWLLFSRDRSGADHLPLTQESMAKMVGVQRTTLSQIAQKFEKKGMIKTMRGNVQLLDIGALRSTSCECYEVVRMEYAKLVERRD